MSRVVKLRVLTVVALAVAALAIGAVAASGASSTGSGGQATLRHFVCQRAVQPDSRLIAVTAVMRPVSGTARMELRFQLFSRPKGAHAATPVSGGDLSRWISPSNPTLGQRPGDVWIFTKRVADLAAPATYHFRVAFRWIGRRGRVLRVVSRLTRLCQQRELRPDLVLRTITVSPAKKAGGDVYQAVIVNAGVTAAGPFQVWFSSGAGGALQTHNVAGLPAHHLVRVSFRGPVCSSAAPPTITVDPTDQVDDANRANNNGTAVCPS